ncbi:nuclear receptor subfamily 1 group I member 3 isoform X1 [Anas platyrhynchos]|uniref:nuclear receptor subfamily 1 group I member 3 isoform X1 n=1 Tax=Anas platyrhynchos TaxID=8839 RepID=UPI003AF2C103
MSVSSPSDPESSPGTQRGPQVTEREDGEPEEEKVCAVCGDRATGYHFHVMTCEGCKGFFRRSINKGVHFTCPFARSCPVTKAKRRQCQACRLQKCLDVGMRKDMIMSEEALGRRRALRRQRRLAREQPGGLTAEQRDLIGILIAAHQRTFDSSFSQFAHYRPAVRLYIPSPRSPSPSGLGAQPECGAEDVLPDVFSMLPHFADLSTFMIQQVIKFAKEIPAFRGHAGDLPDPVQHRVQRRDQRLGVRAALLHHPGRGPGWLPADLPGASAQVPHQPEEAAAARGRVRPAAGHAALLARPRQRRPAGFHRPAPGEGGPDPQELHRPPAPHARGQVPLRQAAAAADGAADAEGGEHAADPAHPGPLLHDAAALRDHQLEPAPPPQKKKKKTPPPPPKKTTLPQPPGVPDHLLAFGGRVKLFLFFQPPQLPPCGHRRVPPAPPP